MSAATRSGSGSLPATQDVVGVFDGFSQVFQQARPLAATVKEESKLMEHPTESGAVVTDHMVIQPVEIELTLALTADSYIDVYEEIRSLRQEARLLTVQTRTGTYENQVIAALPHDETPEVFDAVMLTLKLKEVTVVTASFSAAQYNPSNPAQAPTAERGEVQPEPRKGSWISQKTSIGLP